jgi:hypothetical protein
MEISSTNALKRLLYRPACLCNTILANLGEAREVSGDKVDERFAQSPPPPPPPLPTPPAPPPPPPFLLLLGLVLLVLLACADVLLRLRRRPSRHLERSLGQGALHEPPFAAQSRFLFSLRVQRGREKIWCWSFVHFFPSSSSLFQSLCSCYGRR